MACSLVSALFVSILFVAPMAAAQANDLSNGLSPLDQYIKNSEQSVELPMQKVDSKLVLFNYALAQELGFDQELLSDEKKLEAWLKEKFSLQVLNSEKTSANTDHVGYATFYQDSSTTGPGDARGDGRLVWVGQIKNVNGHVSDVTIKGVGLTPLAWTNHSEASYRDGLLGLGGALNEYVNSEIAFLNGLDVTRNLAVFKLPGTRKNKYGVVEPIVLSVRVGDHLRMAHLLDERKNKEQVSRLLDYLVARQFDISMGQVNDQYRIKYLTSVAQNFARQEVRILKMGAKHGSPTNGNRLLGGGWIDMSTFAFKATPMEMKADDPKSFSLGFVYSLLTELMEKSNYKKLVTNHFEEIVASYMSEYQSELVQVKSGVRVDQNQIENQLQKWNELIATDSAAWSELGQQVGQAVKAYKVLEPSSSSTSNQGSRSVEKIVEKVAPAKKNFMTNLFRMFSQTNRYRCSQVLQ